MRMEMSSTQQGDIDIDMLMGDAKMLRINLYEKYVGVDVNLKDAYNFLEPSSTSKLLRMVLICQSRLKDASQLESTFQRQTLSKHLSASKKRLRFVLSLANIRTSWTLVSRSLQVLSPLTRLRSQSLAC